jgi:thiamine-monophosphate kinase
MASGGRRDDPGHDRETLAQTGEFAVIDRLVAGRVQPAGTLLGPGDDGAVLAAPDGRVVVSTDMLVEGRHFRLDWSSPHDVGRKAIAQNAADVEAMGARVTGFTVAFGAPPHTPTAHALELADGLWAEADAVGAGIVGGDLVAAPQWVISVTVLGDLAGLPAVRRDGARPGDVVAVAGELGRSAAGFALVEAGRTDFESLRRRHLVPAPPYGQGRSAARHGATAMTDVSDGLLADLGHVAIASGVGVDLSASALRTDVDAVGAAARAVGADPWAWVLGGGEDHALAATFAGDPPDGWRVVGRVLDGPTGGPAVLLDGRPAGVGAGWQSY